MGSQEGGFYGVVSRDDVMEKIAHLPHVDLSQMKPAFTNE